MSPAELPLTDRKAVFLTGYMGAGKSTIGKRLATVLRLSFLDTDAELVKRAGKPIANIFAQDGEASFRAAELSLVAELCGATNCVISTGGGTLVREETLQLVETQALLIYLQAPVEDLFERVVFSPRNRPLLDVPDAEAQFKARFAQREPYYLRAHLVANTLNKRPEEVVDWIVAQPQLAAYTHSHLT